VLTATFTRIPAAGNIEFYMDAEGLPQLTRVSAMAPEPKAATAKPAGSKP
jgi:Cu(I)/Ag(I) efflux system membrane fusion protein